MVSKEGNVKLCNKNVKLKLSGWIMATTTSFIVIYITAVSALLMNDVPFQSSSLAVITRDYCLQNGYKSHRFPTRSLTRRFGAVVLDSIYRSSRHREFNSEDSDDSNNKNNKIHQIRDESRSSFWSTTSAQPDQVGEFDSFGERILTLPNVPTLDFDGPLPHGTYRMLGNPAFEPKPTCLLTVAVDVQPRDDKDSDEMNPHVIVKRMQRLIDAGLTTFSLRLPDVTATSTVSNAWCQDWAEENVYGRLLRDTPATALAQTQLIVPMTLPMSSSSPDDSKAGPKRRDQDDEDHAPVTATTIRKTVLGSLQRMGTDCIDTLQLQYVNDSPYHLEVLDYLTELQREGLIRSITGRNLPAELLQQAFSCGFHLDSNQLDGGSLLRPLKEVYEHNKNDIGSIRRRHRPSLQESMSKTGTRLVLASPLAGGLLTERHLGKRLEPKPWEFASESERLQYVSTAVPRWFRQRQTTSLSTSTRTRTTTTSSSRKKDQSRWSAYQQQLLEPLQEIAWKHCVSIAAVSLRYVLQNQQHQQLQHQRRYDNDDDRPDDPFSLASVVVSSRLGATCQNDDNRWDRPQQLRQVFRFALDDEDMKRLHETIAYRHYDEKDDNEETMHQKMLLDSWEQEYDEREMDRLEKEHLLMNQPLPDITNRRLWL